MKQLLKKWLLAALYHSGVLGLYARLVLHDQVVVLTYHRVLPEELQHNSFSAKAIIVDQETFDSHMRLLKKFFQPVTAQQFERILSGAQPLPARCCLVTFDDGWYDNYVYALPVLKRHEVPAVLFLATDYVSSDDCFWQEQLSRMLYLAWRAGPSGALTLAEIGATNFLTLSETEARAAIRRYVDDLKRKRTDEVRSVLNSVRDALERSNIVDAQIGREDRFVSWDNVREMLASGFVSLGSHTTNHLPLTKQDHDSVKRQLSQSRKMIEDSTGTDCRSFAYPNGDFDEKTAALVRSSGYGFAFTTVRGYVNRRSDPFRLKRINIHEAAAPTPAALLGKIVGLS